VSIANRDYLTGLYTRQGLYIIYEGMEEESRFHLMYMDIDNFKNVNDVYGHNEGDVLLQAVARILQESAPEAKAIRLGGDEFVLIFQQEYALEQLCAIADSIIAKVNSKQGVEHITTSVSASIGILYDEKVGGTLNDILARCDRAMYYAKSKGKSQCVVYRDVADKVKSEITMERLQQSALENGQIEIRYLPVINAQSSKLSLTRTCLYWNMPDGTVKSQEEFLPLFERNGFVRRVDLWVLEQVVEHLQQYRDQYDSSIRVGVRVSRLLLLNNEIAGILRSLVEENGILPSNLEIEVEESAFVRGSSEMFANIRRLTESGFSVAIVGVGSEFKSLAYWDKLSFASITFDSTYLRETMSTERGRQILKTLLVMGRQLKMRVMADGVNSREEATFLSGCGCSAISGPWFSEPLKPEEYFGFVKDKLINENESVVFPFIKDLCSANGKYVGKVIGEGVTLTSGISDNWGGLLFPGGSYENNVVELPGDLLTEPSYTVCMWLRPTRSNSWTSAYYARYQNSFAAFSPYILNGNCTFRVSEDSDVNGFHDMWARHLPLDVWTFVCLTYDDASSTGRIYINGRKAGFLVDMPTLSSCRQILLGGDPFQPSYEGLMSGLAFFNVALPDDEVQDMYQKFCEEPGFCGTVEDFWL